MTAITLPKLTNHRTMQRDTMYIMKFTLSSRYPIILSDLVLHDYGSTHLLLLCSLQNVKGL